mgnify:CR=1 FL=1
MYCKSADDLSDSGFSDFSDLSDLSDLSDFDQDVQQEEKEEGKDGNEEIHPVLWSREQVEEWLCSENLGHLISSYSLASSKRSRDDELTGIHSGVTYK